MKFKRDNNIFILKCSIENKFLKTFFFIKKIVIQNNIRKKEKLKFQRSPNFLMIRTFSVILSQKPKNTKIKNIELLIKQKKKMLIFTLLISLSFAVSRDCVVNEARAQFGKPYVWGAEGPDSFDCSGLVMWCYEQCGYYFDHRPTTYTLINMGSSVSQSNLNLADLVFPNDGHVQIYSGNGYIIHAPQSGDVVKEQALYAFWAGRSLIEGGGDPAPEGNGNQYQSHALGGSWYPNVAFGDGDYAGVFGVTMDALYVDSVSYKVQVTSGNWLPEVSGRSDYAGNMGQGIIGVAINGKKYRVHVLGGGWLPWVTGYNTNDDNNGYAGNGNVIDAIQIE